MSDALKGLLEAFARALGDRLGADLSCVVVFGQGSLALCDGGETAGPRPTQLDILVVGQELPSSRWDRHDLVYEALLAIQAERDAFAAETSWSPYFGVHMKTQQELSASGPLPSVFSAGVWVVTDPLEIFASWYREASECREVSGAKLLGSGDRVYWDVAPQFATEGRVPSRYEELARGYLKQAESRMLVTRVAMENGNYAYVVRAAHEAVELSLKAMLARAGLDPPRWHDVGREIREHASRFPGLEPSVADELAAISSKLREHREPSVYGDRLDKLSPDELFSEYDARVSRDWSRQVFEIALQAVNRLSL